MLIISDSNEIMIATSCDLAVTLRRPFARRPPSYILASVAAAPQTADNGANGHEAAAAVEHAAAFVEEPSGLTSWGLCITAEQALVELVAAPRR